MPLNNSDGKKETIQDWEKEILADHRWGRLKTWFPMNRISLDNETISSELSDLKTLWNKIQPLNQAIEDILESIIALEICNWNLEKSIISICKAIGEKKSPTITIGHLKSITNERWKKVWAYYLALCKWLAKEITSGFDIIHDFCDPGGMVMENVSTLLGERNRLKELYVERLCLLFEFWIGGYYFLEKHPQMIAHHAAVKAIEKEIFKKDPKSLILNAMKVEASHHLQTSLRLKLDSLDLF